MRRTPSLAATLALCAFALGGCTGNPLSTSCGSVSTCGDCTPRTGCGWCGATSSCVAGSSTGPTSGTCASGWAWLPSACSSPPADGGNGSDAQSPAGDAGDGG